MRNSDFRIAIKALEQNGYAILKDIYRPEKIQLIKQYLLDTLSKSRNNPAFGVRNILKKSPELWPKLYNDNLKKLLTLAFPESFRLTKSIYFDKPAGANWFVPWHQDISIHVERKQQVFGYTNWTLKNGICGVHPPLKILQQTLTLRIHLDNTDKENGALQVLPGSHQKGIIRKEKEPLDFKKAILAKVKSGSLMLMSPLTMHASKRVTTQRDRRIIHLEFCDQELAHPLKWGEGFDLTNHQTSI